jgi:geranylgeranyl reductase family protein
MTRATDVLVIGAGPAGASAAHACATAGLDVTVVDRSPFPRDKVCGDALIPDALRALRVMGLGEAVAGQAYPVRELRLFPPEGPAVRLAGEFQCVPRVTLDQLLIDAAVDAGATFLPGVQAHGPLVEDGVVCGARVRDGAREVPMRARYTLLATGADPAMLGAFGVGDLVRANAVAVRSYLAVDADVAKEVDYLTISYDAQICPGYGWIFPGPGGIFNVGVGWFLGTAQRGADGLRALLDTFLRSFPLARRLLVTARLRPSVRGAQIRTSLRGARFGRPGLLVVGEAAGSTYAATGEGIGKAMEIGRLGAELVGEHLRANRSPDTLSGRYEQEVRRRYARRFAAYEIAQRWSSRPWLVNLLARRANRGAFVRRQLEELIAETGDPRDLFSARGLLKALVA